MQREDINKSLINLQPSLSAYFLEEYNFHKNNYQKRITKGLAKVSLDIKSMSYIALFYKTRMASLTSKVMEKKMTYRLNLQQVKQ